MELSEKIAGMSVIGNSFFFSLREENLLRNISILTIIPAHSTRL